jgi:hypothetical protein
MKVKIGDTIYDSENEPIMIILSDADKYNITHMHPDATKYCSAPTSVTLEQMQLFMRTDLMK